MRRTLFSMIAAAALGVAVLGGLTAPAGAAERDLKFSVYVADHHWLVGTVFKPFVDDVAEFSNGEVKVTLFTGGVLGSAKEHLQLAESGVADIAFIIPSYTRNRFPYSEAGLLPFAFDSAIQGTKVLQSLRDKYLDAEFDTVKLLFIGATSPSALVTTKPVKDLDDVRGMNLRGAGGAQTAVLKDVGANVVTMEVSDAYLAFQRGALEGTIIPLASAPGYKFEEVIKYVNPINFSVTPIILAANLKTWNSLSEEHKAALRKAADRAAENLGRGFDDQDKDGLTIMKKAGAEVTALPADDIATLKKTAAPLWDEWAEQAKGRGLEAGQFLKDFRAATEQYAAY